MTVHTARRRRWPLYAALATGLLVVAVGAAVGGIAVARSDNQAQPPASPSPTAAADVEDRHGVFACLALKTAMDEERIADPVTVAGILAEAKQSTDHSVQFEAQMLSDRRELADGGKASDVLALQTQAIKMQTACVKAGLTY